MPCKVCNSDFNIFNWKFRCGECSDKYCKKCLKTLDGVMYCEKCTVLLRRPPDRTKLMELKSKDLQEYLQKHNIPTRGLVEKHELVDLLCAKPIPIKQKRGTERLTANFGGSVPNLGASALNEFIGNIESTIFSQRDGKCGASSFHNAGVPRPPPAHTQPPSNSYASHSERPTPHSPPRAGFSAAGRPAAPPYSEPATTRPSPAAESCPADAASFAPSAPPPQPPRDSEPRPPAEPQPTTSTGLPTNDKFESPSNSPILTKYPKLADIENIEELSNMSSKQLKALLTLNRVDYKGCVEKTELLERAERLWHDYSKYKKDQLPEELDELCKLCMDAPLDCVLLECGHIATCINCGKRLAECPICRQYVSRVVRTFKA